MFSLLLWLTKLLCGFQNLEQYGAVSTPKIKVELDDMMVDLFNKLLCLQDTMVWPRN